MEYYKIPGKIAIFFIQAYQKLLSPDHSWLKGRFPHGYCRFYPSCSEYTKQSIERFGLIKGIFLGSKRVARCNPFVDPKIDPVPNFNHQH